MFRKLSSKLKKDGSPTKGPKSPKSPKSPTSPQGGAVPYYDGSDDTKRKQHKAEKGREPPHARGASSAAVGTLTRSKTSEQDGLLLGQAATEGDFQKVRQMRRNKIDVNWTDKNENAALHKAASAGRSRVVHYLLLHGADMEKRNKEGKHALYLAVEGGHTATVGVLLDYMHSVDTKLRERFVLLRANREDKKYFVDEVRECKQLGPLRERGAKSVPLFISYGQKAQDMAVFLYSSLDVEVTHAFFLDMWGELNLKNFQRFESKALTQSLTVLNTCVKTIEAVGYENIKCLILVSCELMKVRLEGLPCLEVLDMRHNRLEALPPSIGDCRRLKTLRLAHNNLKLLPPELLKLKNVLTTLEVGHNSMKRLTTHITKVTSLVTLQCHSNCLLELPVDIGLLENLKELTAKNNKLSHLPLSLSAMSNLEILTFHGNPLQNIPGDFPERANDVKEYLKSLQDDPVPNKTVKLVLVGQEGVGKSTLLKSLKRSLWVLPKAPKVEKTEGIDVKDIRLKELTLRCFDCGGDVDFNETHNFFITQGALYLACFNLSEYCSSTVERGSFLLGRLQLWLQYIFTKVPNSRVIIVGTHADHSSLKPSILDEIWNQVRSLLAEGIDHHRQYFSGDDKLCGCILCQNDLKKLKRSHDKGKTGFVNGGYTESSKDEPVYEQIKDCVIAFPHILGYYEISNAKPMGGKGFDITSNPGLDSLKQAIVQNAQKLTTHNPNIPRKWADTQETLYNHIEVNPNDCVATMKQVAKMAAVQGVKKGTELANMLYFLKAQGSLLYFPDEEDLRDMVILDPQWLAKLFSRVVSFRDTGISEEGFIDREKLKNHWGHEDPVLQERIISILHHFGLCIPVDGTNKELFPCKLPLGEPDDPVWPAIPGPSDRQLTYCVTFPSIIPPPLFSDLIVAVYRQRVQLPQEEGETCKYFSNQIFDCLKLEVAGCRDCEENPLKMIEKQNLTLIHRVHFELIPHKRSMVITVRGHHPCCMMKMIQDLINSVAGRFEGLGTVELDTLMCPGCHMQRSKTPHKLSARGLIQDYRHREHVVCPNAHVMPDGRAVLRGIIKESCLPNATIKPKNAKGLTEDFSGCPKLFIVLPVNRDGLSFDNDLKLFVSSLLFDGYAAHLLCEFPDGYHLTNAPGYRLRKPDQFMKKYGNHVMDVFRLLEHTIDSSVVSPQYARQNRAVIRTIESLLADYKSKFQIGKDQHQLSQGSAAETLEAINATSVNFKREDLRQFLNLMDSAGKFGPLRRLRYGGQRLWLCNDHYKQLRVVTLGRSDRYVESSA